jgi:putative heme iron utilization protein
MENQALSPKAEAVAAVAALLRAGGTAALGVLDVETGVPFTTLVNFAVDGALRPLLFLSGLAQHSKCLVADARGSLLVHAPFATDGDPLLTLRVTLSGYFETATREEAMELFLARHPYAELYASLGDFRFWRLDAEQAHIIAGFGRAYQVRFKDLAAA